MHNACGWLVLIRTSYEMRYLKKKKNERDIYFLNKKKEKRVLVF